MSLADALALAQLAAVLSLWRCVARVEARLGILEEWWRGEKPRGRTPRGDAT